jgi:hypothetical protein
MAKRSSVLALSISISILCGLASTAAGQSSRPAGADRGLSRMTVGGGVGAWLEHRGKESITATGLAQVRVGRHFAVEGTVATTRFGWSVEGSVLYRLASPKGAAWYIGGGPLVTQFPRPCRLSCQERTGKTRRTGVIGHLVTTLEIPFARSAASFLSLQSTSTASDYRNVWITTGVRFAPFSM